MGVVMTSSPGPTPATASAISSAAVAEVITRTGRPPTCSDSAASKRVTCGPLASQPERSTATTSPIVSSSMLGRVKGSLSPVICRSSRA